MKDGLRIEICFYDERKTMAEVLDYVDRESKKNPDREYYMDGDLYSIVSVPRRKN